MVNAERDMDEMSEGGSSTEHDDESDSSTNSEEEEFYERNTAVKRRAHTDDIDFTLESLGKLQKEIDDKDGQQFCTSRWDPQPPLSHMQQHHTHPFDTNSAKTFWDLFNKSLGDCPTSISYAICWITNVSRVVLNRKYWRSHPHSSEKGIVLEGKISLDQVWATHDYTICHQHCICNCFVISMIKMSCDHDDQ